jgi:hypothetical protein
VSATSSMSAKGSLRRWRVSRDSTGALKYHASGKVQASSEPQDMGLQRMLGHLTTVDSEPALGFRHRLRRRSDGWRRFRSTRGSSTSRFAEIERWSAGSVPVLRRLQSARRQQPKLDLRIDDGGISSRRATRSSMPSPPTLWIRGSKARRPSLHANFSRRQGIT